MVETYSYDALSSRTTVVAASTTTYAHNKLNQYDSVAATPYYYDSKGNLTNDGQYKYYYDCENRLTDVNNSSTNAAIAHYTYDYLGRRTQKTVFSSQNTTKFCYDGDQIIAEYSSAGVLIKKYIYGPGIDEPICMIIVSGGETKYYYHYDALGSVVALSDNTGAIVEQYHYDAFGIPNEASSVGNPYLFTGREYDSETSLYYYRARFYKPSIGRFLQADPVPALNLYAYCLNNPIMWVDPWGLIANVSVDKEGNVTIEVPMTYEGKGATKEVIEKFNQGIEKEWGGTRGKYNVVVKVTTPNKKEEGNIIEVPEGNGRARVIGIGGSKGVWPAERPAWTAAHEAGHLMGLNDRYDTKTNKPLPGWENNIMAVHGGKVEERNITDILKFHNISSEENQKEPSKNCKK